MVECQNCQQLEQALRDARGGIEHLEHGLRQQGCCDGRHHMRERRASMRRFIMGCIRQLTTRKKEEGTRLGDLTDLQGREGSGRFVVQDTATGSRPSASQKQLNIRIQSAAADIVTRLITADVIHSHQAGRVEEIVSAMLRRSFEGAMLATKGWQVAEKTSHAFHKELRLRSVNCTECQTDTSVDWLA